jgi:hypothetical protein
MAKTETIKKAIEKARQQLEDSNSKTKTRSGLHTIAQHGND